MKYIFKSARSCSEPSRSGTGHNSAMKRCFGNAEKLRTIHIYVLTETSRFSSDPQTTKSMPPEGGLITAAKIAVIEQRNRYNKNHKCKTHIKCQLNANSWRQEYFYTHRSVNVGVNICLDFEKKDFWLYFYSKICHLHLFGEFLRKGRMH